MGPPPRGGGGCDDSARGGDTSGCPSQLLWRKLTTTLRRRWELHRTTLHGARRPPDQVGRKHPGVLQEPEVQEGAVTVGYVAAPAPFLSSPMLADAAAEAVDARTVKYLLKAALRRREEERRRRGRSGRWSWREETSCSGVSQRLLRRRALLWSRVVAARGRGRRGGKRRLPRSSVPRGGRPHRRQRQWLVFGSPSDVLHCAVFP